MHFSVSIRHQPSVLHVMSAFFSSLPDDLTDVMQVMMVRQMKARKRLPTWHMSVLPWRFCKLGRQAYTNSVISRNAQLMISRAVFTRNLRIGIGQTYSYVLCVFV